MPPNKTKPTTKRTTRSSTKSDTPRTTRRRTKAEQPSVSEPVEEAIVESVAQASSKPAAIASITPARRSKPGNAKLVTQDSLKAVRTLLDEAPPKKTQTLNLRETIAELQGSIESALSKGYSHADVVDLLAQQGIKISSSTLKRYLSIIKPTRSKRGGKRGVKSNV